MTDASRVGRMRDASATDTNAQKLPLWRFARQVYKPAHSLGGEAERSVAR